MRLLPPRLRHAASALRAVAGSTLKEGLQQPVTLLLALSCCELVALQPILQLHTFGEAGRLTRDCGMAFLLVFGVFVAAFTAGSTLAAEIRDGTAATALAKPVSRPLFLLGKFLGACGVAAVFAWCATWQALLAERTAEHWVETARTAGEVRDALCGFVSALLLPAAALGIAAVANARARRRFPLWFFGAFAALAPLAALALGLVARDRTWLGPRGWSLQLDLRLVPLALQLLLLLFVFCALATAFSTRLQTGPAAALSFLVLFLGFLADGAAAAGPAGRLLAALVPDVQHFWTADALARGGTIGAGRVARVALYAATYCGFVLSCGCLAFRDRDL